MNAKRPQSAIWKCPVDGCTVEELLTEEEYKYLQLTLVEGSMEESVAIVVRDHK